MALQAYIDDSCEHDRVLVLAGYIASVEAWQIFADEWTQRLQMRRVDKFHMVEVDIKNPYHIEWLQHLYRVIEEQVMGGVCVAIDLKAFERAAIDTNLSERDRNPYLIAYKVIWNLVAVMQKQIGIKDKIDFIFDKRSERKAVELGYKRYLKSCPPDILEVSGKTPLFEDDAESPPLQAADLIAWWLRRHWLSHGTVADQFPELPWSLTKQMPMLCFNMEYDEILAEIGVPGPIVNLTVTFSSDL